MRHDITITDQLVVVRSGDATVTVYLDPHSRHMVTVNRDSGGPTETISRRTKADTTPAALVRRIDSMLLSTDPEEPR